MNNPEQAMKIISRADAKAQGLTRYYTGRPCKHGHLSERRMGSGACIECLNVYHESYKQTDAGKAVQRAAQKRYKQKEKERIQQQKKATHTPTQPKQSNPVRSAIRKLGEWMSQL